MTVEYRDETPFTNDLHTLQQIADALRHKKFGEDVREAIAQAVEKLYGIGPNTVISGSPAGAYATLSELQSAYPKGQQGVFVVAETGKWYIWNPRENRWDEGGNFQSPMSQNEISDGRIWTDGTVSSKIGDAIRGQVAQEKVGRIQADLQEKTERQEADRALNERIDLRDTALEVKNVRLKDNNGNLLWDGDDYVAGGVYLPKTDKTGLEEGLPVDSSIIGYTFLGHLRDYGLPILKLESPKIPSLQKSDGKLKGVKYEYIPYGGYGSYFKGVLKHLKVQGNTSAVYPKKNFTLKFKNEILFRHDWGKHDKYVIKADWTDVSHMRNEFCASLWGKIRKTRIDENQGFLVDNDGNSFVRTSSTTLSGEIRPQFISGMNLGAVDTYPIFVFVNGSYHGLYSMAVPKDDWMAGMGKGEKEAIVSAGEITPATHFKGHVTTDSKGNLTGDDFEVEYVTDEDDQDWIADSLNRMIDSIIAGLNVEDYLDIDSAIDYFLFNLVTDNGEDKNYLLDTWDGVKWTFAAYDMDSSFGNDWHGRSKHSVTTNDLYHRISLNNLYNFLITNRKEDVLNRWEQLKRFGIFEINNLITDIENFSEQVPLATLNYEIKRWPQRPGTRSNDVSQIRSWAERRLNFIDNQLKNLKED